MISVQYLRPAARPLIQSAPLRVLGFSRCFHRVCRSPVTRKGRNPHDVSYRRSISTTVYRCDSIGRKPYDDSEHVSPFKKQRQTELWEETQSEDPLYEETHPRLKHLEKVMSVPEFREAFHEVLLEEPVNVCGRVRSKRVVGKNLIFLDIVNEFERLQVMVNRSKCMMDQDMRRSKFSMFKNLIEVGDHICRIPIFTFVSPRCLQSGSNHWSADSNQGGRTHH